MMPSDPFNLNSAQGNLFGAPPVDAFALIESANQAFNRFEWRRWLPGPGDEVIASAVNVRAPLTSSIVYQHASWRAWLERGSLTEAYIGSIRHQLTGVWWTASINRSYEAVARVMRDLLLWEAIGKMSEREREAVRPELLRMWEASPKLTEAKARPVSNLKKDWEGEFGPAATRDKLKLLTPIPPFNLG